MVDAVKQKNMDDEGPTHSPCVNARSPCVNADSHCMDTHSECVDTHKDVSQREVEGSTRRGVGHGIPEGSRGSVKKDREEFQHFKEVCSAISSYEFVALEDVARIERNFRMLSTKESSLLSVSLETRIARMKNAIHLNQSFLNLLLAQDLDLDDINQPSEAVEGASIIECNDVSPMNVHKVRATLKQFAREWSPQRVEERKCTFELLCKTLEQYVPLEAFKKDRGQTPWVLCPGSGLGRLPFEVITRGYSCQGNEFSYFMLLGSNFMLNHSLEAECFTLSPFVLATNNRVCDVDNLYTVTIPDVNVAAAKLSPDVDFSMCAGDFLDVYREQKAEWEAVLTCFFIDTAKNIILYIHTIANAIKPGGLWANVGPLLYHFADSPTEMSIELSYEEIRPMQWAVSMSAVVSKYFEIKEEKWVDSFYTTAPNSMLQALYHCIFFAAIRNDVEVPDNFLRGGEATFETPTGSIEVARDDHMATSKDRQN